ncbi:hypothetical protein E3Q18_00160 [Wallemia mellicola]|uniref:Uncharacterized protein n=1 Tax=Wallemia mellicola TaxID=1708541 RepID=A0A4T0RAB0_9BASI|nr:hypothetical protein E3Q18_00160 [Wallemia mellicola]TIC34656.1 hypothetical protein E3Q10_00163 [Wallemia mellicola]
MKWLKSKQEGYLDKWIEESTEENLRVLKQQLTEDNISNLMKAIRLKLKLNYRKLEFLILEFVENEVFYSQLNNTKNISFLIDYNELFIKLYLRLKPTNHLIVDAFEHKYQPVLDIVDGYIKHKYTQQQLSFLDTQRDTQLALDLFNNSLIYNKISSKDFAKSYKKCLDFQSKYKPQQNRNEDIKFSVECYKIAGILDDYSDTFTPDELIYQQLNTLLNEIENSFKEYEQLSLHIQQDEELQYVTQQSINDTKFDRSLHLEIPTKRSYDETASSSLSADLSSKQSFDYRRVAYDSQIPDNLLDNKMSNHIPIAFDYANRGESIIPERSPDDEINRIPDYQTEVITEKSLQKRKIDEDLPSYQHQSLTSQDEEVIDYDLSESEEYIDCNPYAGIIETTTPTRTEF